MNTKAVHRQGSAHHHKITKISTNGISGGTKELTDDKGEPPKTFYKASVMLVTSKVVVQEAFSLFSTSRLAGKESINRSDASDLD